jgi:dTDP-L-rhamnose 4-epimerase
MLSKGLGKQIEPEIVGKYREDDIRHCVADIGLARDLLNYQPKVNLEDGLNELLGWVSDQKPNDKVAAATAELASRQLIK